LRKFFRQHAVFSRFLVALQLAGIACCCFPVGLINSGSAYWLIACLAGAALGILTLCYNKIGNFSVYPEVKKHATLITSGPYRSIRHPMYSSLIIMMVGIAFYNFHWLNAIGVVMVIYAVINKANIEEKLLLMKFDHYINYQQETHRFIPKIY